MTSFSAKFKYVKTVVTCIVKIGLGEVEKEFCSHQSASSFPVLWGNLKLYYDQ